MRRFGQQTRGGTPHSRLCRASALQRSRAAIMVSDMATVPFGRPQRGAAPCARAAYGQRRGKMAYLDTLPTTFGLANDVMSVAAAGPAALPPAAAETSRSRAFSGCMANEGGCVRRA